MAIIEMTWFFFSLLFAIHIIFIGHSQWQRNKKRFSFAKLQPINIFEHWASILFSVRCRIKCFPIEFFFLFCFGFSLNTQRTAVIYYFPRFCFSFASNFICSFLIFIYFLPDSEWWKWRRCLLFCNCLFHFHSFLVQIPIIIFLKFKNRSVREPWALNEKRQKKKRRLQF